VNVPAELKVKLNCDPGVNRPEFQTPLSDVVVCEVESELVHMTVVPTATFAGFGANAVVVSTDAFG